MKWKETIRLERAYQVIADFGIEECVDLYRCENIIRENNIKQGDIKIYGFNSNDPLQIYISIFRGQHHLKIIRFGVEDYYRL